MNLRRLLAPVLCAAACAGGGDDDTGLSAGSASVPTVPTSPYDPSTGLTGTSEDPSDPSNDSSDDPPITTVPPQTADPFTTSEDPATSDVSATAVTTTGPAPDTGEESSTAPDPVTTVPEMCEDTCVSPPGPCFDSPGNCINGICDYPPSADGGQCDDGDECTTNDVCNGAGSCGGTKISCEAGPNAEGGTCQNGACSGFSCTPPYENCDGDWANGCEVPVGVANSCDSGGIASDGCWAAYCGSLDDPKAHNFGTYYCYDCANCHTPAAGQWQWCNHTSGNFYPPEAGNCPAASHDVACMPP